MFKIGFINNWIITIQILSLCLSQVNMEFCIKCGCKVQRDQQGLKLLAANDSKIFLKYENFVCVSVGTRYKL
jgi:hypothetical protein